MHVQQNVLLTPAQHCVLPQTYLHIFGSASCPTLCTFVQMNKLTKVVGKHGQLKAEIEKASRCHLTIPAAEDWDEQLGVLILIEGQNPEHAKQALRAALS